MNGNGDIPEKGSGDRQAYLRQEIDRVDAEVERLINERARHVLEIAHIKEAEGGPFYRPGREAQVLRRVAERNEGPFPDEAMVRIFREIMSSCLALERPMRIAYLGPPGSFSHAAVQVQFGHAVEEVPVASIGEVFRTVDAGQADYGVVPLENSTEGAVNATLDQLIHTPLALCGEVALRIQHNFLTRAETLAAVEKVYVHPQTRAQCHDWLQANMPGVPLEEVASNSLAAQWAAAEPTSAAIAGLAAAEIYELPVLAAGIEDEPENTTRFGVIGQEPAGVSGRDKTSLLVSGPNRPGSLLHMLQPFSDAGVNLTKIVSRPAREALWDYLFFLDVEGHAQDPAVEQALEAVRSGGAAVRVLGSYPQADYVR